MDHEGIGLSYSPWSVDIFDDPKIRKLLNVRGCKGFSVYFFLCQKAYGNDGYFCKWSYDDCASTARMMSHDINANTVRETVGYCLHLGLFDKGLFDRQGILTSKAIQRRYCIAIRNSDVKFVIAEYWLLHEEDECEGLLKLPLNEVFEKIDTGQKERKSKKEKEAKRKKEKERNIKSVKNTYCPSEEGQYAREIKEIIDYLNARIGTHYRYDSEIAVNRIEYLIMRGYKVDNFKVVIDKKSTEWEGTEQAKYLRPSTLFGDKFDEYLTQIPSVKKPQTSFHNFEQRSYDFGAMENQLFANLGKG